MIKEDTYFSVVCPTYNSSNFIEKNIHSLLTQTYKKFEVIYIDDGSTDETLIVLKKYVDFFNKQKINIKILKDIHKGPSSARNLGIRSSKYNWISFIDSDDIWTKNKLEKVNQTIINNKNYNCIIHNEIINSSNGKKVYLDYKKIYKTNLPIYRQLFLRNFISTSTVTLKKKLIEDVNYFDPQLSNAQDYDLWLRIGDKFKLFCLDDFLGFYNERTGNITSKKYKHRIINLIKILKKNKKKINKLDYYYKLLRIFTSREWLK